MLIIEIAVGVFIGGLMLGLVLHFRTKQQRSVQRTNATDAVENAIQQYLDKEIEPALTRIREVFIGRLLTGLARLTAKCAG